MVRFPAGDRSDVVFIYLAGKVPKGAEIGVAPDWRKDYAGELQRVEGLVFLSPEDPTLDEGKPTLVFGHDCHLVQSCDVLLVNGSSKLGVGTAQEMIIAKYFAKLVFVVLPKDSHHRRSNLQMHGFVVDDWVHPFIWSTADHIFESISELADFLMLRRADLAAMPRKTLEVIDSAIEQYLAINSQVES